MGEDENRIGKFTITLEEQLIFEDNPFLLDRLMNGLFILRAEFLSWKESTEYIAEEIDPRGPRFAALDPGEEAPMYEWSIEEGATVWRRASLGYEGNKIDIGELF